MSARDGGGMQRTRVITPPVLYPGTPVVLVSSVNADGSANLAPMSSAWALGDLMVLGLGTDRHLRVDAWRPLFYLFRHYAGRGPELGRSFRATTSQPALDGQAGPGEQARPEHGDQRDHDQRHDHVEPGHGDRERGGCRPLVG